MDLFADDDLDTLALPDAHITLYRRPDLGADPATLFACLQQELDWREEPITLYGKTYLQPRLLAWYGDAGAHYRYSGRDHVPRPWTTTLLALRDRVAALSGAPFNSVLANLYRNEQDRMGLHADDERELGPQPVIASLSLGEERRFRLKHRHRKDLAPVTIPLTSGTLLVMAGETQKNWKHEVPRESAKCGPRINLTFRHIESGRQRR